MSGKKTLYERELERLADEDEVAEYQYQLIRQSKAFMEQNYSDKIELESIARSAHLSRFHFIRLFKKIYGTTPRQFLRDIRIAKAKALLKAGLSVTRVCFQVGYESLPTFSAAFKRGTGRSPRSFRDVYNRNPE